MQKVYRKIDMVGGVLYAITLPKIKIFYSVNIGSKGRYNVFTICIGNKARNYTMEAARGVYKGVTIYKEEYNCDVWTIGEIKEAA